MPSSIAIDPSIANFNPSQIPNLPSMGINPQIMSAAMSLLSGMQNKGSKGQSSAAAPVMHALQQNPALLSQMLTGMQQNMKPFTPTSIAGLLNVPASSAGLMGALDNG